MTDFNPHFDPYEAAPAQAAVTDQVAAPAAFDQADASAHYLPQDPPEPVARPRPWTLWRLTLLLIALTIIAVLLVQLAFPLAYRVLHPLPTPTLLPPWMA